MKDTVLLVDDEEGIRKVLRIALADAGYRVLEAADGVDALALFKQEQPPIVLTDIKMPGMDGVELLRRIKHENPEAEVIMITGHGDMDLAIRSLKHDATDFITKPINDDILEIAVNKAQERRLVREQLRAYTENLEALLREKTALQDRLSTLGLRIGSVSHSIKGLLTGLDGGIYLVDSGVKQGDDQQVAEGWQIVKEMIQRIRQMVLDILFYAKEREMRYETLDAAGFAREVAQVVAAKIRENGIAFDETIPDTLGHLEIDAGYMRSGLVNILENAIDACIQDTTQTDHTITFSVTAVGDRVCFEISDTGIGMTPDVREKIFDLFFSSKGRKGTGMGLFIARKVVDQHGGSIRVTSRPDHGARFVVELPRRVPEDVKTRPTDV